MLYSLDKHQIISTIPYEKQYRVWYNRLSAVQLQAINRELNKKIDKAGIHTSSWMPGSNWIGTVFQPIWEIACQKNQDAAAKCFGLILWEVMMQRPETWAFGRYSLNEVPIHGLTYFQVAPETGTA